MRYDLDYRVVGATVLVPLVAFVLTVSGNQDVILLPLEAIVAVNRGTLAVFGFGGDSFGNFALLVAASTVFLAVGGVLAGLGLGVVVSRNE